MLKELEGKISVGKRRGKLVFHFRCATNTTPTLIVHSTKFILEEDT